MNLSNLNLRELEEEYEKEIAKAEGASKAWVAAKAYFESVDDKRRVILSELMEKTEGESHIVGKSRSSQAAKEQFAYVQKEWADFMSLLSETRRDYYQALVNYDMAKLRIEAIRTVVATRRQEIQSFKG